MGRREDPCSGHSPPLLPQTGAGARPLRPSGPSRRSPRGLHRPPGQRPGPGAPHRPVRLVNSPRTGAFLPKGTFFSIRTNGSAPRGSDPAGGQRLDGLADRSPEARMVGFEAQLGRLQPLDEPVGLVVDAGARRDGAGPAGARPAHQLTPGVHARRPDVEPALDLAVEAGQLPTVVLVVGAADGGRQLVEQMAEVLFHGSESYRTRGLYRMRCGWAASAPRRFFRSAS